MGLSHAGSFRAFDPVVVPVDSFLITSENIDQHKTRVKRQLEYNGQDKWIIVFQDVPTWSNNPDHWKGVFGTKIPENIHVDLRMNTSFDLGVAVKNLLSFLHPPRCFVFAITYLGPYPKSGKKNEF